MDVANEIVTIVAIITTVMTSARILDRLQMMIVIFTNISAIRITNEKIAYLTQHWMLIKSDMNPFSDATLPTSNEVIAMPALHQVASSC
jgi:ascorbate-specific PTS system EIIC-type component UlaA